MNTITINSWDNPVELNISDIDMLYLTWINSYLTINKMADAYGVSPVDMRKIIDLGRLRNNNTTTEQTQ